MNIKQSKTKNNIKLKNKFQTQGQNKAKIVDYQFVWFPGNQESTQIAICKSIIFLQPYVHWEDLSHYGLVTRKLESYKNNFQLRCKKNYVTEFISLK